jgi:hypothetical protein
MSPSRVGAAALRGYRSAIRKISTHIVVDAVYAPSQAAEMRDHFRADQAGTSDDKERFHFVALSIFLTRKGVALREVERRTRASSTGLSRGRSYQKV